MKQLFHNSQPTPDGIHKILKWMTTPPLLSFIFIACEHQPSIKKIMMKMQVLEYINWEKAIDCPYAGAAGTYQLYPLFQI